MIQCLPVIVLTLWMCKEAVAEQPLYINCKGLQGSICWNEWDDCNINANLINDDCDNACFGTCGNDGPCLEACLPPCSSLLSELLNQCNVVFNRCCDMPDACQPPAKRAYSPIDNIESPFTRNSVGEIKIKRQTGSGPLPSQLPEIGGTSKVTLQKACAKEQASCALCYSNSWQHCVDESGGGCQDQCDKCIAKRFTSDCIDKYHRCMSTGIAQYPTGGPYCNINACNAENIARADPCIGCKGG